MLPAGNDERARLAARRRWVDLSSDSDVSEHESLPARRRWADFSSDSDVSPMESRTRKALQPVFRRDGREVQMEEQQIPRVKKCEEWRLACGCTIASICKPCAHRLHGLHVSCIACCERPERLMTYPPPPRCIPPPPPSESSINHTNLLENSIGRLEHDSEKVDADGKNAKVADVICFGTPSTFPEQWEPDASEGGTVSPFELDHVDVLPEDNLDDLALVSWRDLDDTHFKSPAKLLESCVVMPRAPTQDSGPFCEVHLRSGKDRTHETPCSASIDTPMHEVVRIPVERPEDWEPEAEAFRPPTPEWNSLPAHKKPRRRPKKPIPQDTDDRCLHTCGIRIALPQGVKECKASAAQHKQLQQRRQHQRQQHHELKSCSSQVEALLEPHAVFQQQSCRPRVHLCVRALRKCRGMPNRAGLLGYVVALLLTVVFSSKLFERRATDSLAQNGGLANRFAEECWVGEIPDYIKQVSTHSSLEPTYIKPTIGLHAPCVLSSFVKFAKKYRRSASAWYFVRTRQEETRIELRNRHENPVVMNFGFFSSDTIAEFLSAHCLPMVGRLTQESSNYYFDREQGMIIALFEPISDLEEVDQKYRDMLTAVARSVRNRYHVVYMDAAAHREWIASEFGIRSFPNVVVAMRFPGAAFAYDQRTLSVERLLKFVQDVEDAEAGCRDSDPFRDGWRRAFALDASRDDVGVCDATPVLHGIAAL
eukprot:TRINITY_DN38809_c0_g1_i1.p1 TRINITY_DN38809_c0_g1~~TRINITY_DN38809_c0_g1_i1.p1  ORF type:complete len:708 (+),score=81.80 TRINITY_DN38809_c0_g1_i1:82-2205(+)